MPEVRSCNEAFSRSIFDRISPFVVQLLLSTDQDGQHRFGSGLVMCSTPDYYGIVTTKDYVPKHGQKLYVKCKDQAPVRAMVSGTTGVLISLVLCGHNLPPLPCIDNDSLFEKRVIKFDPVWVVGCSIDLNKQIFSSGLVSVLDSEQKAVLDEEVENEQTGVLELKRKIVTLDTFMHTCSTGNVLLGAPLVNSSRLIIGINHSRHPMTTRLNHAMKFQQFKYELAKMTSSDPKASMSVLALEFKKYIGDYLANKDAGASSSSGKGKRKRQDF